MSHPTQHNATSQTMAVSSFPTAAIALAIIAKCFVSVEGFSSVHSPLSRQVVGSVTASQSYTTHLSPIGRRSSVLVYSSAGGDSADTSSDEEAEDPINTDSDPRLRRLRLPRATGIEWGTDLSFSFVYVRDLEPSGAASLSGEVEIGDQICELRAVSDSTGVGEVINLIGAPFDKVMEAFASLKKDVRDVDLVFFRGTKDELKAACAGGSFSEENEKITITVIQNKGSNDEELRTIEAKAGCNLRQVLTDNGINVYQSFTRWTNCKGKQLCGTCIVNIANGSGDTNRKSLDEASTLRENPESYRLSCVTFAYGDITVETFPPIEASQWTR